MSTSDPHHCHTPRLRAWRTSLRKKYGNRIEVVITQNRRSMASIRRQKNGHVVLRLQYGFEHAPQEILECLECMARNRPGKRAAWQKICAFAKNLPDHGREQTIRPPLRVSPKGRHFDLAPMLAEVNHTFFNGKLEAHITWGTRRIRPQRRTKKRTLQYGVWDVGQNLIRIHPDLDRPDVPVDFLRYIIYHELCHAACPPERDPKSGRMRIHHAEFKALESKFPGHEQMEEIGRNLFERLTGRTAR